MDWPSSCRNGTCRTCLGQLVSGSVHYEIDWPGLTAEEKAEGYVLPCCAYPDSDLVLKNAPEPRCGFLTGDGSLAVRRWGRLDSCWLPLIWRAPGSFCITVSGATPR